MEMNAGLRGGVGAVPLLGVDVKAEVLAGHARAVVRQRYRNDETRAIEAVYTFPLPSRAVVTGFVMEVGGRRLEGEVHERGEAFKKYDDAITAGHGAALVEQERPNVFTANVGNLLPGEETIIELEYVEPITADEGAVRWSIPTVVAPRYMPGGAQGERTGHGRHDPTSRVPDADRISPPIGSVAYGLAIEVAFDLGVPVDVESPSHSIVKVREGGKTIVRFTQREAPLDRDVVVTAFPTSAVSSVTAIASVVAHRAGGQGAFALSIVPDLGGGQSKRGDRTNVVFLIDRSGSMGGSSMNEARTALRLCLRQLREGDRFAILAFDDQIESFAPEMVPFTQATLQRADAWLSSVDARGGTELLEPMLESARLAPDGVVVLLTDGQVGNEDEILARFLDRRGGGASRVYSFGIGTNVSDALLQALADRTGGAVESIHPGERVDDKVVAQFARATAPRVTDLKIAFRGVDVGETAPAEPKALVDGEPFTLFGTYEAAGRGAIEIRGKKDGESFYLEVPIDLPEHEDRPVVAKLWAQARIVDLERAIVTGRRADAMKQRIVDLAKTHRVSSKYTSFLVVEKRTGDRRQNAMPETRVVPVSAPAGWTMFQQSRTRAGGMRMMSMAMMPTGAPPAPAPARSMPRPAAMPLPGGFAPPPPPAPAQAIGRAMEVADMPEDADDAVAAPRASAPSYDPAATPKMKVTRVRAEEGGGGDPVLAILARQAASGLWEEPGKDPIEATAAALVALLRLGLTSAHAVHGAQIKKAVEAILERFATAPPKDARIVQLALGVAWLVASGRRTRGQIEAAAVANGAKLGDETSVRAEVERLA